MCNCPYDAIEMEMYVATFIPNDDTKLSCSHLKFGLFFHSFRSLSRKKKLNEIEFFFNLMDDKYRECEIEENHTHVKQCNFECEVNHTKYGPQCMIFSHISLNLRDADNTFGNSQNPTKMKKKKKQKIINFDGDDTPARSRIIYSIQLVDNGANDVGQQKNETFCSISLIEWNRKKLTDADYYYVR